MPQPSKPLQVSSIPSREIVTGFRGRMIHSQNMTHAYWEIDGGSSLPAHQHVHEQVVNMLEGEFELVLDGQPHLLRPGDVLVIPSGIPHGGRAVTDCKILDVFSPMREDYA